MCLCLFRLPDLAHFKLQTEARLVASPSRRAAIPLGLVGYFTRCCLATIRRTNGRPVKQDVTGSSLPVYKNAGCCEIDIMKYWIHLGGGARIQFRDCPNGKGVYWLLAL